MNSIERRIAELRNFIARNDESVAAEPDGMAGAVTLSYLKRDRAELNNLLRMTEKGKAA